MPYIRIARLINFTRRQQAEAKLARVIADLCRSAAKGLVAGMDLEGCLRARKAAIADVLRGEIAAVVGDRWGVEVMAVEIQDVFVQDDEIFEAMQQGFKAARAQEARAATLDAEQALERRRLAQQQALEKDRQDLALEKARREAGLEMERIALAQRRDRAQFERDARAAEDAEALALMEARREVARARVAQEGLLERARLDAAARRVTAEEETRALTARLAAEDAAGRGSLERLFLSEGLPAVAGALAAALEGSDLRIYQGGPLPAALTDLLARLGDAGGR